MITSGGIHLPCAIRGTLPALLLAFPSAVPSIAGEGRVVAALETFDDSAPGVFETGFVDFWRWNEVQRREAEQWSRLEIVAGPGDERNRFFRIRVDDPRPFADGAKAILRLAPYLPPETDAIRLRVKVRDGSFTLHAGGPTAYYGNSDVFTVSRTLSAADSPDWIEVDLSLNHPLTRNYRRAGFSAGSPQICYQRWAQEPLGLYLAPGSQGELWIDRIDLVALGEGRPFSVFAEEEIVPVACLADFEDGRLERTSTLYFAATEAEWFEESWRRSRPLRFQPMALSIDESGPDGRKALVCRGPTAEEVHAACIRASGDASANALSLALRVDAPKRRETLAGAGTVAPLDVLVFVAPGGSAFPWDSLGASPEWKTQGGRGFDYQFTHQLVAARQDLHFAIYHTRRYLPPGEWTHLCLPAADFVCLYGQGTMKPRFLAQTPLDLGELIAVAWVNPWARRGRREAGVTTSIDRIDLVRVPGDPETHRSFWRAPDVGRLVRGITRNERGQPALTLALPGDP